MALVVDASRAVEARMIRADLQISFMASESRGLSTWMLKSPANKICSLDRRTDNIINKNRRKAIFNWAVKGPFF